MAIVETSSELLEALKRHELAIARLYEGYAQKFPGYGDFWMELSREEIQHANWISGLAARVEDGSDCFVVNRFPIGAIKHSIAYVEELANAPDQADFLLMNAISTALYIEKAMIENKYFKVFSGDGVETKRILNALAQSTQSHYQRVHKVWQELG